MKAANITLGQWTAIHWPATALQANREYALVILCDDAETALAIAELGKFDAARERWVTAQPYQVGVLLSSSNASTWTAHQDADLTFELLAADYTESTRLIELGEAQARIHFGGGGLVKLRSYGMITHTSPFLGPRSYFLKSP